MCSEGKAIRPLRFSSSISTKAPDLRSSKARATVGLTVAPDQSCMTPLERKCEAAPSEGSTAQNASAPNVAMKNAIR